jgi:hypothetical protein
MNVFDRRKDTINCSLITKIIISDYKNDIIEGNEWKNISIILNYVKLAFSAYPFNNKKMSFIHINLNKISVIK